ncbi:uncharacterized protein GVI51_D04763 [Nakaseomyces glabratus]|uniref:Transcription factor IWS1 n=1 Tax=Candida glabrata (strain ATCC 2001 / BCRC 20586 / JCM 3761 / NBRC 0622 / NRRL Y-65 / CBS 138) TaxID=284593 RepID=IWS1_CANGA|nr:uncharacterized protein CAGL0D04818g [Nakaseomyces glabratus]Q6FVX3.1 RecName: Full=Transcription factor IWS1 [Nakaseomyces glabratus CBS 138]KAH7590679.1 TFIIS helical bundle-like domain [Nakaseomyces glabratus]KAH7608069.1 TFIIS helical bundle-like domain [Nakaseomyces glabratus]KAH7608475.1 TFIIS helical bundle-like domain [Nakaseomyces glabratus]QHS65256.1 uncharacterized protein GVI51_D04763 [Nakaseomyces glabratus]CAG58532.1 unnamed protein product [Nakaseomyces glabratus]|eukprot:XP_445621.1 uncharacterized protein CAGL0D04818g [[Candida] glabrata]
MSDSEVKDVPVAPVEEVEAPVEAPVEAALEPSVEAPVEAPVESTVEAGEPAPERTRKHIESDDDDEEVQAPVEEQVTIDSSEDPKSQRQILEDRLDRLLKKTSGRRQRADEHDLEQYLDEKILRLKDEMNIAAQMDIETLNKRIEEGENKSQDKKPLVAIQKVKLLPKVMSILSKANLADTILDNNLLQSVRIWLEPLPDGSLPSFEIQKSLFAALDDLPIKTEHLKESGLGRVVIFYTKSKRVEPQLARLAEKLIAEWTRPIIGASDNYRDKRIMQLEFDSEKLKRKSALDSAKRKKNKVSKPSSSASKGSSAQTLYEQAAARRNRAAAPAQTTTDYKYAPVSNITSVPTNARTVGVGSSLNNNELYKKLSSRLAKPGKRS